MVSYFEQQHDEVPEQQTEAIAVLDQDDLDSPSGDRPAKRSVGSRLTDFRGRVSETLQSFDRRQVAHPSLGPGAAAHPADPVDPADPADEPAFEPPFERFEPPEVVAEVTPRTEDARFPVGPIGYNRSAVDERIAELEHELEQLRATSAPPVSITDEIERLGEQTASILVVAHDQAHETTRAAREQADRCLADAAASAAAMTENAKRKLGDLDNETDAIWRERARLLDDARDVGLALIALAEEALERFPGEGKTADAPVLAPWELGEVDDAPEGADA